MGGQCLEVPLLGRAAGVLGSGVSGVSPRFNLEVAWELFGSSRDHHSSGHGPSLDLSDSDSWAACRLQTSHCVGG